MAKQNETTTAKDFSPLLGARISGEKRKGLWEKAAPNASFASGEDYAIAAADALCYAGFISQGQVKSCAGFLSALAIGNQSQVRQLFEKDGEKKGISAADAFLASL